MAKRDLNVRTYLASRMSGAAHQISGSAPWVWARGSEHCHDAGEPSHEPHAPHTFHESKSHVWILVRRNYIMHNNTKWLLVVYFRDQNWPCRTRGVPTTQGRFPCASVSSVDRLMGRKTANQLNTIIGRVCFLSTPVT
jgi:hypothetical protein